MTATRLTHDDAWPLTDGGTARLLVWADTNPNDPFTLSLVDGVSEDCELDSLVTQVRQEVGPNTLVVIRIAGGILDGVVYDLTNIETSGEGLTEVTLEGVAADLGITVEELIQ